LRSAADEAKEAAPYEFASLAQIRAAANLPPDAQLFESVISVGNDTFDPVEITGHNANRDAKTECYPLVTAICFERESVMRVGYSAARFSEAAIKLMLGHWITLLESTTAHPEQFLSALQMITALERRELIQERNNTETPYPATACIHQLFEEQVERTPTRLPLCLEERR
jgi:non-ribosomal peptide synthetase component F